MRIRRWFGAWLALMGLALACSRLPAVPTMDPLPEGRTVEGTLVSADRTRTYRLHLPKGYDGRQRLPLVVVLHGLGATAERVEVLSGFSDLAEERGFLVAYPQGLPLPPQPAWRVAPGSVDVVFLRDLVAHLEANYAIDPDRRYVAGISNGGGMANRAACDAADLFAAAGTVAGAYLGAERCTPSRPVPIVAFHGLADRVVPFNGGRGLPAVPEWAAAWAARNGCQEGPVTEDLQVGVRRLRWTSCEAEVHLYALQRVGHTWPGKGRASESVDATREMYGFFETHPMTRRWWRWPW